MNYFDGDFPKYEFCMYEWVLRSIMEPQVKDIEWIIGNEVDDIIEHNIDFNFKFCRNISIDLSDPDTILIIKDVIAMNPEISIDDPVVTIWYDRDWMYINVKAEASEAFYAEFDIVEYYKDLSRTCEKYSDDWTY